ncbi:hypothetical protein [Micromonospora chersina]|uniref:hypothetical protein n=1 Tax=Micromonospora chersina TaxID=47854 RepID=UPI003D9071C7
MSTDVISSGAGKVGRYFTVVSALPAAVFVSYVYLLLRAGAPAKPMDWSRVAQFHPEQLAVVVLITLVLALAINPMQFPLIQLFEGYWGTSALAVELALIRTAHHRRRRQALLQRHQAASPADENVIYQRMQNDAPLSNLRAGIIADEAQRQLTGYPGPELGRELPTRLGNVLRRYEDAIARPYGLDPLVSVPRLAMVANEREVDYVQNQRVQLELALRTAFFALLATPLTVGLMCRNGMWLLLAAAPYAVAFFAYRGAVALAHEYGVSLSVLTDLSRFTLYERLRLPEPVNTLDERDNNRAVMALFRMNDNTSVTYRSVPSPTDSPPQQPGPNAD